MTTPFARRVRQLFAGEAGLSEDAFATLYQGQLDRVFNYVRYRLGSDEAEDVTADIFVRAWSRRETYDSRKGSQSTWLWAIARNLVTDRLRRRQLTQVELSPDLPSNDEPFAGARYPTCDRWTRISSPYALAPVTPTGPLQRWWG